MWSCIAPNCNYGPVKGHLQRERVLKHAVKCKHLQKHDSNAFEAAVLASKDGSLGAQLESSIQGVDNSSGSAAGATHIFSVSSSGSSNIITGDGRLNRDSLLASGQKVKEERRKKFNIEVNHALVQLICHQQTGQKTGLQSQPNKVSPNSSSIIWQR